MTKTTGSLTKKVDRICADILLDLPVSNESFEDVCVLQSSRLCQPFAPRDLTEKVLGCGLRGCKSASIPTVSVSTGQIEKIHARVTKWCGKWDDHDYLMLDPAPAWPKRDERYCLSEKGTDFINNSGRFSGGYRVP